MVPASGFFTGKLNRDKIRYIIPRSYYTFTCYKLYHKCTSLTILYANMTLNIFQAAVLMPGYLKTISQD